MARYAATPGAAIAQSQIVAYAAAALGISVFSVAINVMLPQLYAKELGIKLTDVGIALFFIRIFDAVSDQVVGFLSDRTRTRWGARKPWIVAGTVITLLSCFYLFMPAKGAGIGYFILWRLAYDVGWTMTTVAYTAWGAELSPNYADRSRINGYSGVSSNLGTLLKNIAPIALFWLGVTDSSAFSLEQFGHLFWICLVVIPLLTAWSMIGAPQGRAPVGERPDLRGMLKSIRSNRPFWFYLVGFTLTSLGQGILTLMFTFYDSYLKVGQWYPYMMTGFGAVGMLGIPVWVRVSNWLGKHRAYAIAMGINVLSIQVFWFLDPSAYSQETVAILGTIVLFLVAFGAACNFVAPAAMLADVVDYGTWKTGEARTGSYFAFHALIMKMAMALGSGMGFILMGLVAYDVREGAVNSAFSNTGLLFTVILLPALLKGIGAVVIWNFSLDRARHDVLRRRLGSRRPPPDPDATIEGVGAGAAPAPA